MYLYENNVVFFILIVELIITVTFLAIEHMGYNKMLRDCEKGEKDNLVIKNITEGRTNVSSVDNFVNKYVSNYQFCGLKLYTIKRICGQLLNFVFITWAIVSIYGVYLEVSIKDILWTTMLGILVVGGLFSIGYSVDNLKYEHIAKINLKNCLEDYIYFNNGEDTNIEETIESNKAVDKKPTEDIYARRERFRKAVFATDAKYDMSKNKDVIGENYKDTVEDKTVYNGKYMVELNPDNLGYLSDYYKEDPMEKNLANMVANNISSNVVRTNRESDEEVVYNIMKEILS